MKRSITLCLSLLLCATALVAAAGNSTQTDDSIKTFWQKFSAAVGKGDKETVASLTKFPVEMSYGMAPVRNKAQLLRRYRQVFNQQANAPKCFTTAQPVKDEQDPKRFTVACPDSAGNEVVIYHFEWTRAGWKFVALDNINE